MRFPAGVIAAAALAAWAATCGTARGADEGITPTSQDGQIVYTYRPARKPSASQGEPVAPRSPHLAAPPEIVKVVEEVSRRHGLDPGLVTTVISVESAFDHRAVSPKGARGLMQLMPGTAREYGVRDAYDPRQNIEGGVAYLKDLLDRYDGDLKLALAAYNAGPGAVERAAGVPRFRETRDYIRRIESRYGKSLSADGASGAGNGGAAHRTIQVERDEQGNLVVSNRRGSGIRLVKTTRKGK